jgi:hypothetical protein
MADEITKGLLAPFPKQAIQIKQVPGQRPLSYVPGHTYIRRLIDVAGNWDWQIKTFEPRPYGSTKAGNAQLLLIVTGTLTIPGLGSRDGMGVQVVTAETGGEDMWKGAQTDALKNAAKLFGVGIDLYGPDYEGFEPPDPNPGITDRRPAPVPHTDIDGPALRDQIVTASKDADAERNAANDTPERRKKGMAAVFAAGTDKGLKQDDVKAIAYRAHKVQSMTDLTADQLSGFWKYLNTTDAETLAQDLYEAKEGTK